MNTILQYLAKLKASATNAQQGVHFLLGHLATSETRYHHGNVWIAVGAVVAVALIIEVWYDPVYEKDPFIPKGAEDVAWYCAGAAFGLLF